MPDASRPTVDYDVGQLDLDRLLAKWRWLCPHRVTLVARNAFGDLFLKTSEGKILWFDVAAGSLSQVADSESNFRNLLDDPAKRNAWFADDVAQAYAERGIKPTAVQCIGFKIPVTFAQSAHVPDNAYIADLYEQVSFLGGLHCQIADRPDGAKVRLVIGPRPIPDE
jgi:hypothetical protein